MAEPHILIADESQDHLLALAFALQCRFRVFQCRNGLQALELLRDQQIDLMILDLSLPELHRLSALEGNPSRPMVLATSRLSCTPIPQCVLRLDFRGTIRKPYSAAAAAAAAEALLAQADREQDHRAALEAVFSGLHLLEKHDGRTYLLAVIPRYLRDPAQSFTKELYPDAGKTFGRSGACVDRAIRYCLQRAWDQGDPQLWRQYFPNAVRCPSNSEFIRRIAQELTLAEE